MSDRDEAVAEADATAASRLAEILLAALKGLAAAGEADFACRLAGQAWAATHGDEGRLARRFDAFLHRASHSVDW